jgi:hypothetical protein
MKIDNIDWVQSDTDVRVSKKTGSKTIRKIIGGYEIIKTLGEGTFGVVYKGKEIRDSE